MKCARCEYKRPIKAEKIRYDYSRKCGIDDCFITAKKYTCPKCKNELIDLGSFEEINQAIAEELIQAKALTRNMIKFVRIHFFQESAFEFAKRLNLNPTVYDELERHKRPMTNLLSDLVQEQIVKHFLNEQFLKINVKLDR